MAIRSDNLLAQYQAYNPGFQPQYNQAAPQAAATTALSAAVPVAGAVMQGVGLLSSLYGNYTANKQADRQYRLQKAEFERQKKIEDEQRAIQEGERGLKHAYDAAGYSQGMDDNRLAKYLAYYRGIGL